MKDVVMYQALYRKYRPRCFSDVAGQEHVTETLRRQIESDRLSHAYLFVGTRGTGKTTCAKILARAANCQQPEHGEPCNICASCVGIEDGSILDVLEIDAASNNSVDNVRALRDEAVYSPSTVKKRVYIIDEVHMLSISAFNALLKILEEPPSHILFILATTELHKVPATILSRCQKFSFKRLSPAALSARLSLISTQEGFELTEDAANKLATLADGSMRDGISLLDQCASDKVIDLEHIQDRLGFASVQQLSHLIEAITSRDTISCLNALDELYKDGKDMTSLLNEMTSLFRDLLVFKLSPDSGLLLNVGFDSSTLSAYSKEISSERLFFCLDVVKNALSGLSRGESSKLSVEMCLMKMCDERLTDSSEALLSRISQLETHGIAAPVPAAQRPDTSSSNHTTESRSTSGENSVSGATHETILAATVNDTEPVETILHDTTPAISHNIPEANTEAVVSDSVVETEVAQPVTDTLKTEDVEERKDNVSVDTSNDHSETTCPTKPVKPESNDFWSNVLEQIKNDPFLYTLVDDRTKARGVYQDGVVIITVSDDFTATQIQSGYMDLLREIVTKILGHDSNVRVEVADIITDDVEIVRNDDSQIEVTEDFTEKDESKLSKLEHLSNFDIIKFEGER